MCVVQELGETACAGAEAVAALSAAPQCRVRFARAHVLHALLPAVLRYDYTLAESGLPTEGDNKQVSRALHLPATASSPPLGKTYK